MLSILESDRAVEIVPLLAARWNSSSVLTADAHAYLRDGILTGLRAAGSLDGVVLSCHGSMVAADSDDPEGELAVAIRAIVGVDVPVAMTLDLHANVTDAMVRELDLIIGTSTTHTTTRSRPASAPHGCSCEPRAARSGRPLRAHDCR